MFGSLYHYELKKIFLRPYVPVLLVLILSVTLFLNLSPLWEPDDVIYVENGELVFDTVSRYEAIQLERRFSQEDTGTLLDNQASDSVRDMNRYYQKVADPNDPPTFIMLNHFLVTDSQMEMGINPIYEGQDNLADFAYETMGGLAGRGIPGSVSHPGGDRVLEPGAQRAGDPLHPGLCQRVQRHPVPGLLAQPDDGGLCLS